MATIEKNTAADGATTWAVRYRKPDGRTTRRRGFKTQRDAKALAATVETSKLKGEFVLASVGRTTIGELGPAWLDRQRGHLKPASQAAAESSWRNHIAPRWDGVRISTSAHRCGGLGGLAGVHARVRHRGVSALGVGPHSG